MATEKMLAANRANALKSTGPRSLAGKMRSSRNALSHGLTAKQPVLPGECSAEREGVRKVLLRNAAWSASAASGFSPWQPTVRQIPCAK